VVAFDTDLITAEYLELELSYYLLET